MNRRDHPTLHLDTNYSKATACRRKNMGVNEHDELSNSTLGQKLKRRNIVFVGFLHLTVSIRSLQMSITHTLKCETTLAVERHSFSISTKATYVHMFRLMFFAI